MANNHCNDGLDNRCRDNDGTIREKRGDTRVRTLRETYGEDFALGFRKRREARNRSRADWQVVKRACARQEEITSAEPKAGALRGRAMHLTSVAIRNFRSLKDFRMAFRSGANLIVGPNAVGKTTVLEAIRLTKAVLAPRTAQESSQVLLSLGAVSPQLPQMFNFEAIAKDIRQPVEIECGFALSDEEVGQMPELFEELCRATVAAQHGISVDRGALGLVQFLSSPMGQAAYASARAYVQENIQKAAATRSCDLYLVMDPNRGISGKHYFSQVLFSVFESRLSPYRTRFSYFPADRALPHGEIPIQLGAVDAQQQLESHNSTPAQKYQRLKNSIFAWLIDNPASKADLENTFRTIFRKLLTGRDIGSFGVNQYGQASIRIKDSNTHETFDIDSMSSGEKGLILTFLIIARSMERGGIILLDEPELHLNPAVCKSLLSFLLDEYLLPNNVQAILCSHSAEIFSTAMRRQECTAYHLRQGGTVSEVRKIDRPEVAQALRLLGTSEVEEMLYEGIVFVEGEDDVELLEDAFPETLSRIKFRELFGRSELEKHIGRLQEAERKGQKENTSYFLFDRDRKPTGLQSTLKVRIKQWDRYCLENYLLDSATLFDVLRKEEYVKHPPANMGEAEKMFLEIAQSQLIARIIEDVYSSYGYMDPHLRTKEIGGKGFEPAATTLFERLTTIGKSLSSLDQTEWKRHFVDSCEAMLNERQQEWRRSWYIECSGKRFLTDLYRRCTITIMPLTFKRQLLAQAMLGRTEGWKLLEAEFAELLGTAPSTFTPPPPA